MGTIKKGILGGVSGKVGNVVGGNWKGIDYLRMLPAGVTNPNTELQSTQRLKFAAVLRFLQPMTEVIRIGFKPSAVKMSAFNAAFSYNYNNALTGSYPAFAIDYPKALISKGNLIGALNPICASADPAKINVTWENNSGNGLASETDNAIVVIFNPDNNEAVYLLNAGLRSDCSLEILLPSNFSGATVHCYLTFMAMNAIISGQTRNAVATSSYVGSVLVA